MSRHMSGPWKFDDDGGIYADGVSIAQVYGPEDFPCFDLDDDDGKATEVCNANGFLIAAAPDLLDACKAAAITLNINRKLVSCLELKAKLDAAIAKAECNE